MGQWILRCRNDYGTVGTPQVFDDPKAARRSLPHVKWVRVKGLGWVQRDYDSDEQWEIVET